MVYPFIDYGRKRNTDELVQIQSAKHLWNLNYTNSKKIFLIFPHISQLKIKYFLWVIHTERNFDQYRGRVGSEIYEF